MCFHSKQSKSAQKVVKRFNASVETTNDFLQSDNINGFQFLKTPVITNDKRELIQNYNWGLIPAWSKDLDIRKFTLNARIETITEKPSFKNNINKRCLVIADGFYEWKWLNKSGSKKEKYLISKPDNELYAYGGIYSEWTNQETGEVINSYSLVTTAGNELMSEIHNIKKRMPIILKQEDENDWLDGKSLNDFALPYQVDLIATSLSNTPTLF